MRVLCVVLGVFALLLGIAAQGLGGSPLGIAVGTILGAFLIALPFLSTLHGWKYPALRVLCGLLVAPSMLLVALFTYVVVKALMMRAGWVIAAIDLPITVYWALVCFSLSYVVAGNRIRANGDPALRLVPTPAPPQRD